MASMFRLGVSTLGQNGLGARLCKVGRNPNVVPVAFMRRQVDRVNDPPKPLPYPYWRKQYKSFYSRIRDPMFVRYDDNTRLIFVEGPPASGKSEFAQKIADEFDLIYLPTPNYDEYYINAYGFDLRDVDHLLPLAAQSCDVEKFLTHPTNYNTSKFQYGWLCFRIEQHVTAMRHILNTGRGVVLNKSVFSTFAYIKAMRNAGYINDNVYRHLKDCFDIALEQLFKPQLVIYLDVPAETVQKNIKKRGVPYEVNSKVFTTKYLQDIEDYHKREYLPSIAEQSRTLIYDWQEKPNIELIYQDIENLDMDTYQENGMFNDWLFVNVGHAVRTRRRCEQMTRDILNSFPIESAPEELVIKAEDKDLADPILEACPGEAYLVGNNLDFDHQVWLGTKTFQPGLRRTPRDYLDPHFQQYVKENWEKYRNNQ